MGPFPDHSPKAVARIARCAGVRRCGVVQNGRGGSHHPGDRKDQLDRKPRLRYIVVIPDPGLLGCVFTFGAWPSHRTTGSSVSTSWPVTTRRISFNFFRHETHLPLLTDSRFPERMPHLQGDSAPTCMMIVGQINCPTGRISSFEKVVLPEHMRVNQGALCREDPMYRRPVPHWPGMRSEILGKSRNGHQRKDCRDEEVASGSDPGSRKFPNSQSIGPNHRKNAETDPE